MTDAGDDLKDRLRDIIASDHQRGCHGREYSCECGYDARKDAALAEALARIEHLERAVLAENEACARLLDGWTVATNSRHVQGWGGHTEAVVDMLVKRDEEIATAIRSRSGSKP